MLTRYYFCSQTYGHLNVRNELFFVFSADGSNKLVTVWFNAPERSYLVLPENGMINKL